MYDWATLADILNGQEYISFSNVDVYEKHGRDLKNLKEYVVKSGDLSLSIYFAKAGDRKVVKIGLWTWIIVTCVSFICYDIRYGVTVIVVLAMWFLHYNRMSKREFGGITGDLAGWYVETCELAVLGAAVVLAYILRICGI